MPMCCKSCKTICLICALIRLESLTRSFHKKTDNFAKGEQYITKEYISKIKKE